MTGTEVATPRRGLLEKTVYDQIDARRLALIRAKVSRGYNAVQPTDDELASALELAYHYDLDFFADEIWLTKTKGRDGRDPQLLIMVGRNGLRKIARRNGLDLRGDVVREKDVFRVRHNPDRTLEITHEYDGANEEKRGAVLGAWAEVWDQKTGRQMGYNFAPYGEYMPTSEAKVKYSPWGSTLSIMMLTAAERNALRQAVPLGGLIEEGAEHRIDEEPAGPDETLAIGELISALDVSRELKDRLFSAITRLIELSPNSWGIGRAQMTLPGRDEASLTQEAEAIEKQIAAAEERLMFERRRKGDAIQDIDGGEIQDAQVVEEGAEDARSMDQIAQDEADSIDAAEDAAEPDVIEEAPARDEAAEKEPAEKQPPHLHDDGTPLSDEELIAALETAEADASTAQSEGVFLEAKERHDLLKAEAARRQKAKGKRS